MRGIDYVVMGGYEMKFEEWSRNYLTLNLQWDEHGGIIWVWREREVISPEQFAVCEGRRVDSYQVLCGTWFWVRYGKFCEDQVG